MKSDYQTNEFGQADSAYSNAILAIARSWYVLPVHPGEKRPRVTWANATTNRATIDGWEQKWPGTSYAIVCGKRSGLAVLDLDSQLAIDWWEDQQRRHGPIITPTVHTPRGRHVYLSLSRASSTTSMDLRTLPTPIDAEFRADKRITVAAGSVHANGGRYEWIVGPENNLAPVPKFLGSFFCGPRETDSNCSVSFFGVGGCSVSGWIAETGIDEADRADVERMVMTAIRATLPKQFGTRNTKVFALVRKLKAIEPLASMPVERFDGLARIWHAAAGNHIRTRDATVTVEDFRNAWKRCAIPEGTTIGSILRSAAPAPETATARTRPYASLCNLLAALQSAAGDGVAFYLSARTAAKALSDRFGVEIGHATANRMMLAMQNDGLLEAVKKFDRGSLKATRYIWHGLAGQNRTKSPPIDQTETDNATAGK